MVTIQNAWLWIVEHYKEILTFLTSANVISVAVAVSTIVKNRRSVEGNTKQTKTLNNSINAVSKIKEDFDKVKDVCNNLNNTLVTVVNDVNTMKQNTNVFMNEMKEKVNSMIKAQGIVYGTINDTTIRKQVSQVLNSAETVELRTTEELLKEINNLKQELAKLNEFKQVTIDKVVEEVNKIEQPTITRS